MRPIDLMDVLDDLPEELIAQELKPKPRQIHVYRAAVAAACLAVTLGLVHFVWNRQQPVPSLPPDTVETVCTETTAASSSAETTSEIAENSAASETALLPETTVSLTEGSSESTVPAVTSSVGTIPDVTVPQTSAAIQPADTGGVTETTALPHTDPTEITAPPETSVPPETTDPTEGVETSDPAEAAETDAASTGTSSTVFPEPPHLTGFVCTLIPNAEYPRWSIQVEPDTDDPTDFSLDYAIDRGRYSIIGCDAGWQYRLYTLYDRTAGETIELRQDFRRSYRFYWNDTGEQPIITPDGIRGFLAYDTAEQSYALCWDDGNYVMTVHADQLSAVDTGLPLLFHAK